MFLRAIRVSVACVLASKSAQLKAVKRTAVNPQLKSILNNRRKRLHNERYGMRTRIRPPDELTGAKMARARDLD